MNPSVLICGVVRNCAQHVEKHVTCISTIFENICGYEWYVVESDSKDETLSVLNKLSVSRPEFNFFTLGDLAPRITSRTERIAFCRNHYLHYFYKNSQRFSHVVVIDLDDVNNLLTEKKVLCALQAAKNRVIVACQKGPYYDVWALRHPVIAHLDCYCIFNYLLSIGYSAFTAHFIAIFSKMRRFDRMSDLFRVDSAFGGFGIYPAGSLKNAKYVGKGFDGSDVCEHVALSQNIRDNGYEIFIHPLLTNAGYTSHFRNNLILLCLYALVGYKNAKRIIKFFKG